MALEFKHTNSTFYFGMAALMRVVAKRRTGLAIDSSEDGERYHDALMSTSKLLHAMLGLPDDLDTSALDARLLEAAPQRWRDSYAVTSGITWFLEAIMSADGISSTSFNRWCYDGNSPPRTVMYRGRLLGRGPSFDDLMAAIKAGDYPLMAEGRLINEHPQITDCAHLNSMAERVALGPMREILDSPDAYPWQVLVAGITADPVFYALPWAGKLPPIPDHFARLSFKDPGLVSFYESEAKARAGRRLAMKPGRYLTRFYPDLSADEVREWASKADMGVTLKLADTSDEIVRVYENGPNSCMSHDASDYSSRVHPCAVYESPDLKLAYVEYGGKISARCLVWPDKKIHGRIYGDEIRLRLLLEREGYTLLPRGDYGDLGGARLTLIRERGYIVAPYLDGNCYAHVADGHLVIGRDPNGRNTLVCNNTNGFASGSHDEEEEQLFVADLDEYRDESWVEAHCYYDNEEDEWNRHATRVVTMVGPRGGHLDETYFADESVTRRAYLCTLNSTWYANTIDRTEVLDGDGADPISVPTARMSTMGIVEHNGVYVTPAYAEVLKAREAEPLAEAA